MSTEFQISGKNSAALFSLKVHRGEGMCLLAMNWKNGMPPTDFVGFAIEYKEPGGTRFFALKNRLAFANSDGSVQPNKLSTLLSPIQKFRWVHFPRNAEMDGIFTYRVTPVFMNPSDELSYGDAQEVQIELNRETYPDQLNICFTRGFVSSQAFVDRYVTTQNGMDTLIPVKDDDGPDFKPTHPKAKEALDWMGFEARRQILNVLDQAIADTSTNVKVVAFDLSEHDVIQKLEQLGGRLQIIIDNSDDHAKAGSGENQAEDRLKKTAGASKVLRQKMGNLQHNKTIVVDGPNLKIAVCGSTNYTWRGFFVQANNAIVVQGTAAIQPFLDAFEHYWSKTDDVKGFAQSGSAGWSSLGIPNIDAEVSFSPHIKSNAILESIASDIATTKSSLFYSLAFLSMVSDKSPLLKAIKDISSDPKNFVYGIADKPVGGLTLQAPDGNVSPVFPKELSKNLPEPFKSEPSGLSGGVGTRMHHKFVVIDFNKPSARVYMGSFNFSNAADTSNGENLLLIKDRKIAVSYMIEAVRLFDHYQFRVAQREAKHAKKKLILAKPPVAGQEPWWQEDYTVPRKVRDREIFS